MNKKDQDKKGKREMNQWGGGGGRRKLDRCVCVCVSGGGLLNEYGG